MEIAIVLVLNAAGLFWCYTQQSDKVTDLIYSLSFFLLTALLWYNHADSLVHHFMFIMVGLWSIRLGSYLFLRIHAMGKDDRFDEMRKKFFKIAGFWTLQTISILILAVPILILFGYANIPPSPLHYLGLGLWGFGLVIETIADWQKFQFKKQVANKEKYMSTGLWSVVQHPNYLGEILCWIGVFVVVIPSLQGWQWLAIVSPLWISLLLIKISGIPLLQKAAAKKYGHLVEYQNYQSKTALLVPFIY